MRTRPTTTGALAALATAGVTGLTGLLGPGLAAADAADAPGPDRGAATSTTTHERGIVVECTGTFGRRPVYTSLYENNAHGNVIQVLVGRDGHRVGGSRSDADGFLHHGRVRGAMKVGPGRAVVRGTAHAVGDPIPVSEEHDDAGEHITATGTNRSLATHLRFVWQDRRVPLTCATAFRYDLQVTRESTVG
jgi:hypothetical protein